MNHDVFLDRCLQLAELGKGNVAPNPMVGSVIVLNGKIIGEGYHQVYGGPHAEVNAIESVKDKSILKNATIYVNLEPCSHFGKTPPCSDLIIKHKIPRVVIGAVDNHELVAGKGLKRLKDAGIEVIINIKSEECHDLNKRFYHAHETQLPYIILKWAETKDGHISRLPASLTKNNWISGKEAKTLSHSLRSTEQAIVVGKNTILVDDPQLTTRLVKGKNPIRVLICSSFEDIMNKKIITDEQPTLIFNLSETKTERNKEFIKFDGTIRNVLTELFKKDIHSLIVEGGTNILQQFIDENLWNEAYQIIGNKTFIKGIPAPKIKQYRIHKSYHLGDDVVNYIIK